MSNLVSFHVLGSGNPFDARNHIYRARLQTVLSSEERATVIIHGRQQAGMASSEAQLGFEWLQQNGVSASTTIWLEEKSLSTREKMRSIVSHLHPIGRGTVIIVTNWIYVPRARYLLRKAWESIYPNTPWHEVAPRFRFKAVSGTFMPYWKERGWRAVPWWLWTVGVREFVGWVKA